MIALFSRMSENNNYGGPLYGQPTAHPVQPTDQLVQAPDQLVQPLPQYVQPPAQYVQPPTQSSQSTTTTQYYLLPPVLPAAGLGDGQELVG